MENFGSEWHCLTIDGDPDPEDAVAALVEFVRREYEHAGSPTAFCVYHDNSRADRPVFFFSPEASAGVSGLECFETAPCLPPSHPDTLARIV